MAIAEIPYEFIGQRVELDWAEIEFGLDHKICFRSAPPDLGLQEWVTKPLDSTFANVQEYKQANKKLACCRKRGISFLNR